MRRGHRRTQSANISYVPTEEHPPLQPGTHDIQNRNEIVYLLNRCEANIKEKVCSVETLNAPLHSQQSPLFNFGKGITNPSQQQQQRDSKLQYLVVIPENGQQPSKHFRRMPEAEPVQPTRNSKVVQTQLKRTKKESAMGTIPFKDVINKILRERAPPEPLFSRQLSTYDYSLNHLPKHRKQLSGFK